MDMYQSIQQANELVMELSEILKKNDWTMACAESCTGGLLAKTCTDLAGSSVWFDRAWVTYSNAAKIQMLGVKEHLIEFNGAVSEEVAIAMLEGVIDKSGVAVAASITGIAGPGGGTEEKPVGTVCFAFFTPDNEITVSRQVFDGNREQVRMQAVIFVLEQFLKKLN